MPIPSIKKFKKKDRSVIKLNLKECSDNTPIKKNGGVQEENTETDSLKKKKSAEKVHIHIQGRKTTCSLYKPKKTYVELLQEIIKANDMEGISKMFKKLRNSIINNYNQDADIVEVI